MFLEGMGAVVSRRDLRDTPRLVARAWTEELLAGYRSGKGPRLKPLAEPPPDALVVVRGIRFVSICRHHLLTAFGLRSLAPGSPAYHPHYGGGVLERDGGYHQGPVWGWLLGPFSLAAYRVSGDAGAAQAVLNAISDTLEDQAVGTIGEIFDGDPPHHPRGAPAQAWSVACTLDAWRLLTQAESTRQA